MSETVDLPGVGKVKTTYVYAGGALVAGIVGYAWWTRRSSASASTPQWDVDSVGETSYVAPKTGDSSYTGQKPAGINTNLDWAQAAYQWAQQNGWDSTMAGIAVALYLARQPVSTSQEQFLQSVTAQIGEPPESRPWKIIKAPLDDGPRKLPDLTRPGYGQIPGAEWKYTVARPGETYADIGKRVFPDWGAVPDRTDVIKAFRDINNHITGDEPQAGDLVAYR